MSDQNPGIRRMNLYITFSSTNNRIMGQAKCSLRKFAARSLEHYIIITKKEGLNYEPMQMTDHN